MRLHSREEIQGWLAERSAELKALLFGRARPARPRSLLTPHIQVGSNARTDICVYCAAPEVGVVCPRKAKAGPGGGLAPAGALTTEV
jgi:hypothetical protein